MGVMWKLANRHAGLISAVVALALLAGCSKTADQPKPAEIARGLSKGEALEVTAKEIHEAFKANGLAANEKYKGKAVRIEGVVQSVGGRDGKASLDLSSGFRCYFDDNHIDALRKLSKGQIIGIRGVFGGKDDEYGMRIEKCDLVEPKPHKLELSASQFYSEGKDDRDLRDARYSGKTLQITGKFRDWNLGLTVFLDATNPDDMVMCEFDPLRTGELRKISKGQIITVRGKYAGGAPALRGCVLVK